MHSVTAKLNQAAREHANQNGVTFFVSLGEKNYDFKNKSTVWTNYDAALFAKDAQIEFYRSVLVQHAVIEVSGSGIIMDVSDPNYPAKLVIQDAKLGFVNSPQGQPAQQAPAQQYAQQPQQGYQQPQGQQPPPPPQNQPQGAYQNPNQGFNGQ